MLYGFCVTTTSIPVGAQHTCDDILVYHIYRIMYALELRTVYALTRGLFLSLFPELRSNERNKHQDNTRVTA